MLLQDPSFLMTLYTGMQQVAYGGSAASRRRIEGSSSSSSSSSWWKTEGGGIAGGIFRRMVSENPILVVGMRDCCMMHVVKGLLHGLGVNPAVCEVSEEEELIMMELGKETVLPVVFIGGRLVGGIDRLIAEHISPGSSCPP